MTTNDALDAVAERAVPDAAAPARSMPQPAEPDPRMPRLTEVPGFRQWMREGWGGADRTPVVPPGARMRVLGTGSSWGRRCPAACSRWRRGGRPGA
ncbi:hypothetical protein GCM10025870_32240 [Agromyces marinus]|uniref:Uncharacterized protein n=1 Tax=Agromyces marinus TaxID=1389020 RepID=A0ABM8H5Q1_9MICO|nr:hypothetical protein [Agromyces marinus]BDZ56151.1 hypothetical protein GCM10025870_32240 [Agromyces marinus]